MTFLPRVSLVGWKSWERRRRHNLRAVRGVSMSQASLTALYEARCRARIGQVIGRPAAKALHLTACRGGLHDDPQFVLAAPIEHELWLQLEHIPGLLRPIDEPSE